MKCERCNSNDMACFMDSNDTGDYIYWLCYSCGYKQQSSGISVVIEDKPNVVGNAEL